MLGILSYLGGLFTGKRSTLASVDYVVLGLGNPGDQYYQTRHNAGFEIIDRMACSLSQTSTFPACSSLITLGVVPDGPQVALVKPQTFMNRSGDALREMLAATRLPLGKLLVVVDDFNLPLGSLRLRGDGSDGGHNGLKSIASVVGNGFARLRVGIGPLPRGVKVIDFVLGKFDSDQQEKLSGVYEKGALAAQMFVCNGLEMAMSRFNG